MGLRLSKSESKSKYTELEHKYSDLEQRYNRLLQKQLVSCVQNEFHDIFTLVPDNEHVYRVEHRNSQSRVDAKTLSKCGQTPQS